MGLPKGSGLFYSRNEYLKAYQLATIDKKRIQARIRYQNLSKQAISKIKLYRKNNQRHYTDWQIKWNKEHPTSLLTTVLKSKYGITLDYYLSLLNKQKNRCAICRKSEPFLNRRLAIDHCHRTGKVRGLLCTNCNTFLGRIEDNPKLLERAIAYVKAKPVL